MRLHPTNLLICGLVSGLIAYGIFQLAAADQAILIATGSFVAVSSTLALVIGLSADNAGASLNMRVVASLFTGVLLVVQLVFALAALSTTAYVLTTGILFLLFILIAKSVVAACQ